MRGYWPSTITEREKKKKKSKFRLSSTWSCFLSYDDENPKELFNFLFWSFKTSSANIHFRAEFHTLTSRRPLFDCTFVCSISILYFGGQFGNPGWSHAAPVLDKLIHFTLLYCKLLAISSAILGLPKPSIDLWIISWNAQQFIVELYYFSFG